MGGLITCYCVFWVAECTSPPPRLAAAARWFPPAWRSAAARTGTAAAAVRARWGEDLRRAGRACGGIPASGVRRHPRVGRAAASPRTAAPPRWREHAGAGGRSAGLAAAKYLTGLFESSSAAAPAAIGAAAIGTEAQNKQARSLARTHTRQFSCTRACFADIQQHPHTPLQSHADTQTHHAATDRQPDGACECVRCVCVCDTLARAMRTRAAAKKAGDHV